MYMHYLYTTASQEESDESQIFILFLFTSTFGSKTDPERKTEKAIARNKRAFTIRSSTTTKSVLKP